MRFLADFARARILYHTAARPTMCMAGGFYLIPTMVSGLNIFSYHSWWGAMASLLHQHTRKQEELYLKAKLSGALELLEEQARATLQLEEDLTRFIEHYYHEVGGYVEKLTRLEAELSLVTAPGAGVSTINSAMHEAALKAQHDRAHELKRRYRAIAKVVHPDAAESAEDHACRAERMREVNEAYEKGDLARLVSMEAAWARAHVWDLPEDARMLALREHIAAVEKAAEAYRAERNGLMHSPVYELMLRATSARLAGRDWIGAVVDNIKTTIAAKERRLVNARLEALSDWRHQRRSAEVA